MEGKIEVVQEGAGFFVRCPIHGRVVPDHGMVWTSHFAAGLAAMSHAMFSFHGAGAR